MRDATYCYPYGLELSWICFMLSVTFWYGNEWPGVLPIDVVVVLFPWTAWIDNLMYDSTNWKQTTPVFHSALNHSHRNWEWFHGTYMTYMRFVSVIGVHPKRSSSDVKGDWIPKGKQNLYDGQFWSWFFFRLKPTISKWRTPCKFCWIEEICLGKQGVFFLTVFLWARSLSHTRIAP